MAGYGRNSWPSLAYGRDEEPRKPSLAAKASNAAHGAKRGQNVHQEQAPNWGKASYDTAFEVTAGIH
jgi:hypothetical protein